MPTRRVPNPPAFVVLDVETTGLDPTIHSLLEVGIVVCDADLQKIDAKAWVLSMMYCGDPSSWAPAAREMHQVNGLIETLRESTLTVSAMEGQIISWLEKLGVAKGKFPMVGSSVHFDRKFLQWQAPGLEQHFHYRNIDCSTLKELVRVWLPGKQFKSPPNKAHRTLQDATHTIAELTYYRDLLFKDAATEASS